MEISEVNVHAQFVQLFRPSVCRPGNRFRGACRMLCGRASATFIALLMLSACSGPQSALHPRGPAAASIAELAWVMFIGAAIVLLLVTVLLVYGLFGSRRRSHALDPRLFIVGGGLVLPIVVLSALLVYSFSTQSALVAPTDRDTLVVEVTGHQWWWEFRYLEGPVDKHVTTANEMHIPAGRPVELRLEASDVIHTFWVPNLAGKRDMIPGRTNILRIEADRPGLFRGQCNEFCGEQHALMNLYVVAEPAHEFDAWLERQRDHGQPPRNLLQQRGEQVFMSSGCAVCHTVRGTDAQGTSGPDLTHFGSRRSIAAIPMPNTHGNRMAWIASTQHLKSGSRMPEYRFDSETLRALSAYLGNLE